MVVQEKHTNTRFCGLDKISRRINNDPWASKTASVHQSLFCPSVLCTITKSGLRDVNNSQNWSISSAKLEDVIALCVQVGLKIWGSKPSMCNSFFFFLWPFIATPSVSNEGFHWLETPSVWQKRSKKTMKKKSLAQGFLGSTWTQTCVASALSNEIWKMNLTY